MVYGNASFFQTRIALRTASRKAAYQGFDMGLFLTSR
jgi:hypothetical protein